MRKIIKIIGIIFLVIVIATSMILIKYKMTTKKVTKLEDESDIYITYVDSKREMTSKNVTYDLININKKKLYKISWKYKSFEIHGPISEIINRRYTIKTRNITDKEINDLLEMIEEEIEKQNNRRNNVKTYIPFDMPSEGLLKNYFSVKYKGETVQLDSIPFSY